MKEVRPPMMLTSPEKKLAAPDHSRQPVLRPNPEVLEKPRRRRFTAAYKLRILQEVDALSESGQICALLRREGLYSSNLTTWRRQRDNGTIEALSPKKRGRKALRQDPLLQENEQLRRQNDRLAYRLKKAEAIIDFQKKISEILGIHQPEFEENDS
jgi:transposase-like protein